MLVLMNFYKKTVVGSVLKHKNAFEKQTVKKSFFKGTMYRMYRSMIIHHRHLPLLLQYVLAPFLREKFAHQIDWQ